MNFIKFIAFIFICFYSNFFCLTKLPIMTGECDILCYETLSDYDGGLSKLYTGTISMQLYEVVSWGNGPRDCIVRFVDSGTWSKNQTKLQMINEQSNNTDQSGAFFLSHVLGVNGQKRYCLVIDSKYYIYFTTGTSGDMNLFIIKRSDGWQYYSKEKERDSEIISGDQQWSLTSLIVQNSFGSGNIKVNDISFPSSSSPIDVISNSYHKFEREEQNIINGSKQDFNKWNTTSSDPVIYLQITNPTQVMANYLLKNSLSLVNSFGIEGGEGIFIIKQEAKSAPIINQLELVNTEIEIIAPIQQISNEIWCNFSHWGDGGTTNVRTIYLSVPTNITAYYTPSFARVDPMAAHIVGNEGDFVKIDWNEHPNPHVTQYQVWRKLKNGTEEMLNLLPRGNTEYTDGQYKIKYGSDATTLFYAVTPFYAPTNTWSPKCYDITSGEYFVPEAKVNNGLAFSSTSSFSTLPSTFTIENFPNPFNPTTTISYQLPADNFITIKIFDVTGKEIAELVNENKTAGYYTVNFDAAKLPSGIYICTMQSGKNMLIKKMILLK